MNECEKQGKKENHSCWILTVLERISIEYALVDKCAFLELTACRGLRGFRSRKPLQSRKPQKMSFSANWICREVFPPVSLICPALLPAFPRKGSALNLLCFQPRE